MPGVRIRGFSLVEVLITLLIMSVGVLGVAGLFVHSIQAGRTAMLQQQALRLAADISERIRANPGGGVTYEGTRGGTHCESDVVACDPQQMAGHDIGMWQRQALRTLPDGQVAVTFETSASPPQYTVLITWFEPNALTTPRVATVIPVSPQQVAN